MAYEIRSPALNSSPHDERRNQIDIVHPSAVDRVEVATP